MCIEDLLAVIIKNIQYSAQFYGAWIQIIGLLQPFWCVATQILPGVGDAIRSYNI